ncbi:MAG: extracellular solute-binding protein [Clostridia bacterium]|nr:extracellular solute-binding protein [Clostridia bacterium]MBR6680176.1 extracellular solute-binding protein [Clostridia bacterium]
MKKVAKLISIILCVCMLIPALVACSGKSDENTVIVYTSTEDYRIDDFKNAVKEKFPDYTIKVEYMNTGTIGAKIKTEGTGTECDIIWSLEYGYLSQLADEKVLADVTSYDLSKFTEDVNISNNFVVDVRNGGAIIVDSEALAEAGLPTPTSYEDLLKPEYKGLICMPSPKSSGTGYMFLKSLVNEMGEEAAFEYFEKLNENIYSYTSSGSGPVNALFNKEAVIGLGMISQAVNKINDGADFDILFFEEGAPYSLYGSAMIEGKQEKAAVKEVFDFIVNEYTKTTNEKFFPEKIFNDYTPVVENYPTDIDYSDMSNDTMAEKERLLAKWKY